jgi:uncharacterized membrane protein YraQ (UPF0718 family)
VDTFDVKVQLFFGYFISLVYEAMPFIVLGAVIAGLLEELLPQTLITRILPRRPIWAILVGGLLGLVFPMCECGIIPIMRRLLRKGLPLSCCIAYLLAGPVINPVVLWSTWWAFSGVQPGPPSFQMPAWWMVGLRAGLSYVVAVSTSLIVEQVHRRQGNHKLLLPLAIPPSLPHTKEEDEVTLDPRPWPRRLAAIAETALHDFIDITVFLIIGAAISAFVRLLIPHELLETYAGRYPILSIILMMALAVVLCLCSEADAFIAASFRALRPSAKLAFLVLGPDVDFKLYLMYTRVFRPRLIFTVFASVIILTFILSLVTHGLWEHFAPQLWPTKPPGP